MPDHSNGPGPATEGKGRNMICENSRHYATTLSNAAKPMTVPAFAIARGLTSKRTTFVFLSESLGANEGVEVAVMRSNCRRGRWSDTVARLPTLFPYIECSLLEEPSCVLFEELLVS